MPIDADQLVQELTRGTDAVFAPTVRRMVESPVIKSLIEKANQLEELHVKDSVRTREHNMLVKENRELANRVEGLEGALAALWEAVARDPKMDGSYECAPRIREPVASRVFLALHPEDAKGQNE